jgi:hypothetical protein
MGVSTVKKSQATAVWEWRNCDQMTSERFGGWVDAVVFKDLPHGRRSDPVAEACEFAVDTAVAPGRVLAGEATDLVRGWWVSWPSGGLCPASGYAAAVPSEEGVGCDDPACSVWSGECCGDCTEQGLVVVVECGSVDLAA